MSNVTATFNSFAADYDASRRRMIGPFDSFYGIAAEALSLAGAPPRRVLDLGAGTGLMSAWVLDRWPGAELTLLDGASEMLAQARVKLAGRPVQFVEADMTAPLPAGPWDAIVSSLAIHHLSDSDKYSLYSRVHEALAEDGIFVNADQVLGPTPGLEEYYLRQHELEVRAAGGDDAEWQAALVRMRHDRSATLDAQLDWLRDAGFGRVDCFFKQYRFAVMVAAR